MLKRLYGTRLFHCRKPFCSAYTRGFETKESLAEHIEVHSLNHRCGFAGCIFANIGFRSSDELSRHVKSSHETLDVPDPSTSSIEFTAFPADQEQLFSDAVVYGHFDAVRRLASRSVLEKCRSVITLAGWFSPPDLLSWLLDHEYFAISLSKKMNEALHAAIEGENLPNIKLLLSRGADISSGDSLYVSKIAQYTTIPNETVHMPGVLRALRRWNVTLMKFLVEECGVTIPRTWDGDKKQLGYIFGAAHLSDATPEHVRSLFNAMKSYIPWPEVYTMGPYFAVNAGPALVRISLENGGDPNGSPDLGDYSPLTRLPNSSLNQHWLEIMELLLEYKADPNKISGSRLWKRSALEMVAHAKGGARSLECAECLLRHGADPNIGGRNTPIYEAVMLGRSEMVKKLLQHGADPANKTGRSIEALVGMKKVEKYFGIPWKDIVRRIQAGEDLQRKGIKGK